MEPAVPQPEEIKPEQTSAEPKKEKKKLVLKKNVQEFDPLKAEQLIAQQQKKKEEEQEKFRLEQEELERRMREEGYDPFYQDGYRWHPNPDHPNGNGGEWIWQGGDDWEQYADENDESVKDGSLVNKNTIGMGKAASAPVSTQPQQEQIPPPPPKIPKYKLQQQEEEEQQAPTTSKNTKFTVEKHYQLKELVEFEAENWPKCNQEWIKVNTNLEPVNIVFIGHVDAGKSTLSGRILKDTGQVKEEDIRKFEETAKSLKRESWVFAYIMDTDDDERSKGKTVECGKANFNLKKKRYTLIDAPGHKNYVPNMIMGACQADVAALIISSKMGEFESGFDKGGQTREHAHLAKALGVEKLICVVTQMDTNNWDEQRYKAIKDQVHPWLEKSCGYTNITWVPIDGFGGINMLTRVDQTICQWYKGNSLFEILDDVTISERKTDNLRMPVLDKVKEPAGYAISGKIESGFLKIGMNLAVLPTKKQLTVLNIHNTQDLKMNYAGPGENIVLSVQGLDEGDVERGYMITNTDSFCMVSREFIAEITLLELPEHKQIMSDGYQCIMHLHTAIEEIEVLQVQAVYDKDSQQFIKSTFLKSGDQGMVRIEVKNNNVCLEQYQTVNQLGRFTFRDEGVTLGYGKITKIKPIK